SRDARSNAESLFRANAGTQGFLEGARCALFHFWAPGQGICRVAVSNANPTEPCSVGFGLRRSPPPYQERSPPCVGTLTRRLAVSNANPSDPATRSKLGFARGSPPAYESAATPACIEPGVPPDSRALTAPA